MVVRHGQASVDGDDYDVLSSRGEAQARALGTHWRRLGVRLDGVFVGPRARHRHTCDLTLDALGGDIPSPVVVDELDEHAGQAMFLGTGAAARAQGGDLRSRLATFRDQTRKWVRGELEGCFEVEAYESWSAFRQRVGRGLDTVAAGTSQDATIAVFTSGGPVAAMVGRALALPDETVLELSWAVRNATVSELRPLRDRFALISFNAMPHLVDPDLVTFI